MKVHTAPQGSTAWLAARAGVISASNFHLLRSSKRLKTGANKGDYSEAAKNYAFRLAVERISGQPLGEEWVGWQAERGQALEPEARRAHELQHDVLVEEVGFVTTDDGKFGASADGFIGDDEGAEYKCFLAPDKLRAITLSGDTSDVIDQCDGGLWLTGRKRWHFGLYCPALKPIGLDLQVHIIERDDDRIFELEKDLVAFDRLVTEYMAQLLADSITKTGQMLEPPWETTPKPRTAALPVNPFA